MIAELLRNVLTPAPNFFETALFDENTFYAGFLKDLRSCHDELLIESPFLSERRIRMMSYSLVSLVKRGVLVTVNTRHPNDLDADRRAQAWDDIRRLEMLGIRVHMISGNLHRKIGVIDEQILWEGSLNILSQGRSREIMRRIESRVLVRQMLQFTCR